MQKLQNILEENKYNKLHESFLLQDILLEEWSLDQTFIDLTNLKTFKDRLNYIKSYYGKSVGRGSSRVVYRVSEDKVLKIAMNKKGLAQNENEVNVYDDPSAKKICAKIYKFDEKNYTWILSEYARKLTASQFSLYFGHDFTVMGGIYLGFERGGGKDNDRVNQPYWLSDSPIDSLKYNKDNRNILGLLQNIIDNNDLSYKDIFYPNSWGRTLDGRIVLIDSGLSNDIYTKYYDR